MSEKHKTKCSHSGAYIAFIFHKKDFQAGGEELMCFVCNTKLKRFPDQKSLDDAVKFEKANQGLGCYIYFHD
jgi:hypothetical protein